MPEPPDDRAEAPAPRPAPNGAATPIAALDGVVLDLETTGLDIAQARMVSVATLPVRGGEPAADEPWEALVDPGIPIPAASTAIHGIDDGAVAGQPDFAGTLPALAHRLEGRVAIGHNIGFDLAVLARESARAGVDWSAPRALDTALLAAALKPGLPDASLESVAAWLGVPVSGRHTAAGDVRTTAAIFAALLPRLAEAGVRTLAEADAFVVERAGEALRRHERAGWLVRLAPRERAGSARDPFAYRHTLAEVMSAPPVFAGPEANLAEALATMDGHAITAVFVGEAGSGRADGILTDFDAVHALAEHGAAALDMPVSAHMTAGVEGLPADAPVYRAIGRLERLDIRHLAVTGEAGQVVGSITARDLLRRSASAALVLGDAIAVAKGEIELARAFAEVPSAARALREDELATPRIAQIVSAEVRALTARAAVLAQERCGAAPGAWSLLVLGSAGRGESLLVPDQDNALIHDDAPGMEEWAADFGQRVNDILDAAGLPYCKGGVMAGRADWRHGAAAWRERLANWVRRASPEDLLNVDIFFDFVAVAGEPALAARLREESLAAAHGARRFIATLNEAVSALRPPRGLFGRVQTRDGRFDAKAGGLLPIVAFARAAALHNAIPARATTERLDAAAAAGAVPEADARALKTIHTLLVGLALDQQLADIEAGIKPSYRVEVRRLTREQRDRLNDALSTLDGILSLAWSTLSRGGPEAPESA